MTHSLASQEVNHTENSSVKSDENLPKIGDRSDYIEFSSVKSEDIFYEKSFGKNIIAGDIYLYGVALVASHSGGFYSDSYNRLYIDPAKNNLGNVTSSTIVQSSIWNSFTEDTVIISSVSGINSGGITAGIDSEIINPNQQIFFDVIISTNGQPIIDAELRYNYSGGYVSQFFTGSRLVALDWTPLDNFVETIRWRTSVNISEDGTEERIGLLDAPRTSYQPRGSLLSSDAITFKNSMIASKSAQWGVQSVFEQTVIKNVNWPAGTETINFDTRYAQYVVGGYVYLFVKDGEDLSIGIGSLTDTSLTFNQPLESEIISSEVRICPLRFGYVNGAPTFTANDGVGNSYEVSCDFDLNDDTDILNGSAYSLSNTYDGINVLEDFFEFDTGKSEGIEQQSYDVDFGSAKFSRGTDWEKARLTRGILLRANNKEETWDNRQFLYSQEGQLAEFFLPTYQRDFVTVGDILPSASGVIVKDQKLLTIPSDQLPDVRITYPDGSVQYNTITAVAEDDDGELISFEHSTTNTETVSYLTICRMNRVRMASDEATISHNSTGSTIQFSTIGV